jgi:hypothetical protein
MAISHSFAGEHVEDGSDEEADADRNHHEIEHGVTSAGVLQTLGTDPGNFQSAL